MQAAVATASLIEAFVSFQGEGPTVGAPTFFVRTAGCPLRCSYCDTTYSYRAEPSFQVRDLDDVAVARLVNPVEPADVLAVAPVLDGVRWLSLTGGEPLLFPGFGRELFELAHARGLRTLLETAALDARALAELLPVTDHLSMDYKLPSTLLEGGDPRDAHDACLQVAREAGTRTSVKLVLTTQVTDSEWLDALMRLRGDRDWVELVVQPVTPCLAAKESVPAPMLRERARRAIEQGFDVLVLPQVHPQLGLA